MRTASHPYNNRHRQAPSTHTDKQAVRTMKSRTMFDYPRVHFECHAPEQNWRFCCLRTFQFCYVMYFPQEVLIKIKHFSQTIKVLDCFLFYTAHSSAKLHPQNANSRQCKIISSQTHTPRAGSHLCFRLYRNNPFAGANVNIPYPRIGPYASLHSAYLR